VCTLAAALLHKTKALEKKKCTLFLYIREKCVYCHVFCNHGQSPFVCVAGHYKVRGLTFIFYTIINSNLSYIEKLSISVVELAVLSFAGAIAEEQDVKTFVDGRQPV